MRIFALLLFSTLSLFASPLEQYLELMKAHPKTLGPLGNYEKGEIEIVLDVNTILQIQNIAEIRLLEKGVPPQLAHSWSRIGVIAEDQYLYLLRDGVIFPSGIFGTYDRVVWKSGFDGSPP